MLHAIQNAKINYSNINNTANQISTDYFPVTEYMVSGTGVNINNNTVSGNTEYTGVEFRPKIKYDKNKEIFIHLKATGVFKKLLLRLFFHNKNDPAFYYNSNDETHDYSYYTFYNGQADINNIERTIEIEDSVLITDPLKLQFDYVGVAVQAIPNTNETYQFTIDEFYWYQINPSSILNISENEMYNDNFIPMISNMFNKIDTLSNDIINNDISYDKIVNTNNINNIFTEFYISGTSAFVDGYNNYVTVTKNYSGIVTNKFQYEGDDILYKITFDATYNSKILRILIYGYDAFTDTSWKAFESVKAYDDGTDLTVTEKHIELTIDPANFAVYKGKSILAIAIDLYDSGTDPHTLKIENMSITKVYPYENYKYYDKSFIQLFTKLNNGIESNTEAIESLNSSSSQVIVNPLGNKYDIRVNNSGQLVCIPHIPNKIIFIGNSFLLGQTFYGMCATHPTKDWYYLTMQAIKEKNPNCVDYRCAGAWFEMLGTQANLGTKWNEQKVRFVGSEENTTLYYNDIFQSDIDCVIIQLGDNADGTEDRLIAYNANLDAFCQKITTKCPNARLIFMGSSARYEHTREITEFVVNKYNMEFVNIYLLKQQFDDFDGVAGQTYLTTEGTYETTPQAWLSHPGDGGHQHLADAVISLLDM